jgi:hypothetical protein
MKLLNRALVVLCAALFLGFVPARANHVDKGVSGKGDINPTTGCSATTGPCVNLVISPTNPNQASWSNFNFDGTTDGTFDLFMVPTTGPATFQLTDPTSATNIFGTFTCGFSPETSPDMGGFCTNIGETIDSTIDSNTSTSFADSFLGPTSFVPNSSGQITLDFTGVVPPALAAEGITYPTEWVFYATAGTATLVTGTGTGGGGAPVPEPASLLLMGSGLVAIGAYKRRRAAAEAEAQ